MPVLIFLPPNLAATATRDAIAVKIEHSGNLPGPLGSLAGEKSPAFMQMTRDRLRRLVTGLKGQPVFFWVNQPTEPIRWDGDLLSGVSEHLQGDPSVAAPNEARLSKVAAATSSSRIAPRLGLASPRPATSSAALGAARTTVRPAIPEVRTTRMTVDGSEHFIAITLPSREDIHYNEALDLLKNHAFLLEPSNRKWWLRDRHRALNFLARYGDKLRNYFYADFTENFEKNTAHVKEAEIAADAKQSSEGFEVLLSLRAGKSDENKIREALASGRNYIEDNGKVHLLDPVRLEKLASAQRALTGNSDAVATGASRHRISNARLVDAQVVLEDIIPGFQPPETWKQKSAALRNLSALTPAPLPEVFDRQLRLYQRIGVAWLWHLHTNELGGVLADEMGLGKTLQALGLLTAVHSSHEPAKQPSSNRVKKSSSDSLPESHRPSLVVCPASLVENWRREAQRFAPDLKIFVHHGAERLTSVAEFESYHLLITSYGTLVRDRETFADTDFACVIADEAQHIKNRRTQNAQALRALHAQSRFLLTGTPVENSLEDLRSLFEFLLPGYLSELPPQTRGQDKAWYNERLQLQTAPYLLRRTKMLVAPELPAKIEQVIYCEPTSAQNAIYRDMQSKTERELIDLEADGASEGTLRLAALTQLLRLRQICCDPRLVDAKASADDSAKLDALRELLSEAVDDGHRVLIFSQFTSLLALLKEELAAQELTYCYLDGSMPPKSRQAEVDRFNKSADIPVFLISLKAGGTGLNLTGADTVVHFDPWWNPAAEAQATDRAHRIGQTKVVTSYKLICTGTVEEKVMALQDAKRVLLANVFEASDAANAKLSLADLKALLT